MRFTNVKEFLPQQNGETNTHSLRVKLDYSDVSVSATYDWLAEQLDFANIAIRFRQGGREILIAEGLPHDEALDQLERFEGVEISTPPGYRIATINYLCFLKLELLATDESYFSDALPYRGADPTTRLQILIHQMIHVPGLRKPPERTYPVARIGVSFPGTVDNYVGSIILNWAESGAPQYQELIADVLTLKLASYVTATRLNDTQIEVRVGRASTSSETDTVSIADVGIGVSQALPVLVALRVARKDQLVYIEQPELHLHPRAQVAMAHILADAAKRGVRVVIETHSSLLLRGVQTLVAEGKLDPKLVALHWFSRDDEGNTKVDSADLDAAGAFGDWPEDFGDVELRSQSRYLDAAEERLAETSKNGR